MRVESRPKKRYTSSTLISALRLATAIGVGLVMASGVGCRDSSASSAERQTEVSPALSASPPDVVLPGVDTSAMTPRERHEWSALANRLMAPCPEVPTSVAQCVRDKRACDYCLRAAKWVSRAVRDGLSEGQIERAYRGRFDPAAVKVIPIDGSPTQGPSDAKVTVVELVDFECPHCREAAPQVEAMLDAYPGRVRIVFKSYVLSFHAHAEAAARAAFAAGAQGKFWEMEHVLFERQQHLEDADIERYATALKLDMAKWKADLTSPAVTARLERDHKLGEDLKVKGTPTIYVNGRELDGEDDDSLSERVASELGVAPVTGEPAAASGTGARSN